MQGGNRGADLEDRRVDTAEEGAWGRAERVRLTHTRPCVERTASGSRCTPQGARLGALQGPGRGARGKQEEAPERGAASRRRLQREGGCVADALRCTADTNTTL